MRPSAPTRSSVDTPAAVRRPCRRRVLGRILSAAIVTAVSLSAVTAGAESPVWELVVCADPSARPTSHRDETGYDNRVAKVLADELGARLTFHWIPQERTLMSDALRTGVCDAVVGVAEGTGWVLTTLIYYRGPCVFVYRTNEDYGVFTFDDPILRDLRIGIQPVDSPPNHALMTRGLGGNIIIETRYLLGAGREDPLETIVAAVAEGDIDVAVMWGPAAGFYAGRQSVELTVTPTPPFEPPLIQMYINIAIGVRFGDEGLRDLLDIAIVNRRDEIQMIFAEARIPTMPLVPPILTLDSR